jgi:hypothetical protein
MLHLLASKPALKAKFEQETSERAEVLEPYLIQLK